MMSCRWFPKSSRSVLGPPGPSKVYSSSTLTIGSLRRSALSASRWRVNSFSLRRSVLRAASHSARDTTFAAVCGDVIVFLSFRSDDRFAFRADVGAELLRGHRRNATERAASGDDQEGGRQTHRAHPHSLRTVRLAIVIST